MSLKVILQIYLETPLVILLEQVWVESKQKNPTSKMSWYTPVVLTLEDNCNVLAARIKEGDSHILTALWIDEINTRDEYQCKTLTI